MQTVRDDLSLDHRGELRDALIQIEAEDGGFVLLDHGQYSTERPGRGSEAAVATASIGLFVDLRRRIP